MFGLGNLFGARSNRIDPATAARLVAGGAMLLDVRTPQEFAGGAAKGAVNIPVQQLATRIGELPRNRPIVAYCRSGARSASAVASLVSAGYDAHDAGALGNVL
ncbi:MAG: rhodanese-like domain-containing protein [Myxococcales bacterium]|nr:rhodanese-like domain-containing protein [Myxococcales bacterium]MCB9716637.1 rhodanese-like domain-containing protein [Myxococcales bacterium]